MPLTERDVNVPLRTPPLQKTPQSQSNSRLPRRVTKASNPTPPTTQWSSPVAGPVSTVDTTASKSRKPSVNKRDSISIRSYQKIRRVGQLTTDRPLQGDKPLPPHPIATLSNALSTREDSRGLVDAYEKPLQVTSIDGGVYEWPVLEPQLVHSTKSPTQTDSNSGEQGDKPSDSSPMAATPASVMTAATRLTNVITGKESNQEVHRHSRRQSPASSYASAVERSSAAYVGGEPDLNLMNIGRDSESTDGEKIDSKLAGIDLPPRQKSVRDRISSGSLITPSTGLAQTSIGFADFTDGRALSPVSPESRPHTLSPASFSRPRPGSISDSNMSPKGLKTASRIPIFDSKKATVIDVKKAHLSIPSTPLQTIAPAFGSRRLASPDALKILENGKMRRQLKRNGSISGAQLEPTHTTHSNTTTDVYAEVPSLSHSLESSPDNTLAPNSPDIGEYGPKIFHGNEATALKRNLIYPGLSTALELPQNQRHDIPSDMFDEETLFSARLPPSTSPFTEPLQTIPSEVALSIDGCADGRASTEFSRTLSRLEGKGSPPKTDIDAQALMQMFAHLKRGFESNSQNTTTFMENAAVAEKFLAQRQSSAFGGGELANKGLVAVEGKTAVEDDMYKTAGGSWSSVTKQTPVSKWSESTPSDKDLSPPAEGFFLADDTPSTLMQQISGTSGDVSDHPRSIGYPSRVPRRDTAVASRSPDEAARVSSAARRRSSPTLGKPKHPGSVRAAREGLQVGTASFARTTASAESRRTTKMPTPNTKAFVFPERVEERRRTSAERGKSNPDGAASTKTPRSRSKSRYVMDKINGIFSGKRDKRIQNIPPIPRTEGTKGTAKTNGITVSVSGSPVREHTKTPQLPKMPSLSPSSQLALRSVSRATSRTDDTTLVDSFTAQDDSQSVQLLSEHLLGRAKREMNPQRKERLLNFAKVLNDSLISAREAQISAETAQHAARSAQLSYEMTQKSLAMLQKLASSLAHSGSHNNR